MAALNGAVLADVLPHLKEVYTNTDKLTKVWFTAGKIASPILANLEVKRMSTGEGRSFVHRIATALPNVVSHDWSEVRDNDGQVGRKRWVVPAVDMYVKAEWAMSAIQAAENKGGDAVTDIVEQEMDGAIAAARDRISQYVSGRGFGKVLVLSATPSTTTITFDRRYANRIREGQRLCAAAAEATGTLRNANAASIVSINRDASATTATAVLSRDVQADGWASGDTVFFFKDRENAATPTRRIAGLEAWLDPTAASGGESFMGNDRTTFGAGQTLRTDGTGLDYPTAFIQGMETLFAYDADVSLIYCAPADYSAIMLDKEAAKSIQITINKGGYNVGFDALKVTWGGYSATFVPDAKMFPGTAWGGPFDNADYAPFLAVEGELVQWDDRDGSMVRRVDDADEPGYRARGNFHGNVITPGPQKFMTWKNLGA